MHIFRGILSISGGSEKAFPRGDIVVDVDGKLHAEDRLCINFQGRRQLYTIENWSESLCGRRFENPGLGGCGCGRWDSRRPHPGGLCRRHL